MISNIMPCFKKCFYPNRTFYLQVLNNYTKYIYIDLRFNVGSKLVKKESPVFKPGTFQRLTFPSNAIRPTLRVLDASQVPPDLLCVVDFPSTMSRCFKVTGHSLATARCKRVPC